MKVKIDRSESIRRLDQIMRTGEFHEVFKFAEDQQQDEAASQNNP